MKIKIMDDYVHEYEDVTRGEVYEVVDERPPDYVIIDDQFDRNAIVKEHCEIITEESMFKEGDRVKIVVKDASDIRTIEEWSLQGNENKVGEVVEISPDGEPAHTVDVGEGGIWCVPEQLLYKIPETTSDATEEDQCEIVTGKDMFKKGDRVKIVINSYDGIHLNAVWALDGVKGMCGEVVSLPRHGIHAYDVQLDNGSAKYVPEELLQKLPCEDDVDKPDPHPTLNEIIRFTQRNKGFSVSFEDGNITLTDWSNDPNATFYRPKTLEELLELMGLIEKINEYKFDND